MTMMYVTLNGGCGGVGGMNDNNRLQSIKGKEYKALFVYSYNSL